MKCSFNIIFILGGPGTGKGEICSYLAKKLSVCHISVGNLLRKVKSMDRYYNIIQSHMTQGSIVPSWISCKLIEEELLGISPSKLVLIDGFPRNLDNFVTWQKLLSRKTNLVEIIHVVCNDFDILRTRCLARKSPSRIDDELNIINARISQYQKEMLPLINYLTGKFPVITIDNSKTFNEVHKEVFEHIEEILKFKSKINSKLSI